MYFRFRMSEFIEYAATNKRKHKKQWIDLDRWTRTSQVLTTSTREAEQTAEAASWYFGWRDIWTEQK